MSDAFATMSKRSVSIHFGAPTSRSSLMFQACSISNLQRHACQVHLAAGQKLESNSLKVRVRELHVRHIKLARGAGGRLVVRPGGLSVGFWFTLSTRMMGNGSF